MKSWKYVISLLLLIPLGSIAQGWNYRYPIGEFNGYFNSVVEGNDGYYLLGRGVYDNSIECFFVHIDFEGQEVEANPSIGPYYALSNWPADLEVWDDELLVNTGFTLDDEGMHRCYIGFWNLEGEVVDTVFHYSPLFDPEAEDPMDWYRMVEMTIDPEDHIYGVSYLENPYREVARFDENGVKEWSVILEANPEWVTSSLDAGVYHEGILYVNLYWIANINEAFSTILRFDAETGEQLSSISMTTNLADKNFDFLITEEGDLIAAGGYKHPVQGWFTPGVGKIDTDGNIVWDQIFGDGEQGVHPEMKILVDNGDGTFTAAGDYAIVRDEPDDTLGWIDRFGLLTKMDYDGNVIWSHTYSGVLAWTEENIVNDMIATSDGGYLFCGESRESSENNPDVEDPMQRGWAVKVDEFGCVEPGCQYVNVNEITIGLGDVLSISPNPSDGLVNLQIDLPEGLEAPPQSELQLYSITGELVYSQQLTHITATRLNLQHLANGTYIAHWVAEGRLLDTVQVVVGR